WKSLTDVNPEWIYRNQENWWSAGETGPCGPDSELWWDRGPEVGCGQPDCYPDHCERFLEFWNLVFMQYDRQRDGSLPPLPRPCMLAGSSWRGRWRKASAPSSRPWASPTRSCVSGRR